MKPLNAAEAVRGDRGGMCISSWRDVWGASAGSSRARGGGGALPVLAASANAASLSRSFSDIYSNTDLALDSRCSSPRADPRCQSAYSSETRREADLFECQRPAGGTSNRFLFLRFVIRSLVPFLRRAPHSCRARPPVSGYIWHFEPVDQHKFGCCRIDAPFICRNT